jgi:hypothetical protein
VYLSGTSHAARTDSAGRFRLDDLAPGFYQVAFHHAELDAAGIYPEAASTQALTGQTTQLRLTGPTRAESLAALCPGPTAEGAAVVTGTVRAHDGEGEVPRSVTNARVTAEWTSYQVVAGRDLKADVTGLEIVTGPSGRFRFCDVPPGVRLTIRADAARGTGTAWGARRTVIAPRDDLLVVDLTLRRGR